MKTKILATVILLASQASHAGPPDARVEEYVHSHDGRQHYFITAFEGEKAVLAQPEYARTYVKSGRSFAAWSRGAVDRPEAAVAVSRFLIPGSGSHVYVSEVAAAQLRTMPQIYVEEGIAFYTERPSDEGVCPSGQKAIFSASDNAADTNYRYSTDIYEQAAMVAAGFAHHGAEFCSNSVGVDLTREDEAHTPRTSEGKTTLSGVITSVSGYDIVVGSQRVDLRNARIENSSLAGLTVGSEVSVEGALINGAIVASEISRRSGHGNDATELEGYVTAATSLSMVYVNGMLVDISGVSSIIPTVGSRISVHGVLSNGVFMASKLETKATYNGSDDRALRGMRGADGLELKGVVTNYAGIGSFTVNGQLVNATNAILEFQTGIALTGGMIVELHGNLVSGVFVATRVEVKSSAETSDNFHHGRLEIKGSVSEFASLNSFKVAGMSVDASSAYFKKGSAAMLRDGVRVEVKGTTTNGILDAAKVEFDSDSDSDHDSDRSNDDD